jgi:hypothetical protein
VSYINTLDKIHREIDFHFKRRRDQMGAQCSVKFKDLLDGTEMNSSIIGVTIVKSYPKLKTKVNKLNKSNEIPQKKQSDIKMISRSK